MLLCNKHGYCIVRSAAIPLGKGFTVHIFCLPYRCEEERTKALEAINGHYWKGQTLKAKVLTH